MYLTKKHLSRRTVLRGMGVSMAMPLLDAMIPAQALPAQAATAAAIAVVIATAAARHWHYGAWQRDHESMEG